VALLVPLGPLEEEIEGHLEDVAAQEQHGLAVAQGDFMGLLPELFKKKGRGGREREREILRRTKYRKTLIHPPGGDVEEAKKKKRRGKKQEDKKIQPDRGHAATGGCEGRWWS
jgi:hypothetical protein